MKATDFEYRHQLQLHLLIVSAAFLTYLIDRDDIVWRFVKTSATDSRHLERYLFAIATILFGVAAYVCTAARAGFTSKWESRLPGSGLRSLRNRRYFGEFLYAISLASLAPLSGFLLLTVGETIRLVRLALRGAPLGHPAEISAGWPMAFRREAAKWGLFLTMIVFTLTLNDRIAEILAGAGVLIWILLQPRKAAHSPRANGS